MIPAQRQEILRLLDRLSELTPDVRFGQLIANLSYLAIGPTTEAVVLNAEVEGYRITSHAMVMDEIGEDENGKPIEILFGALAMQQWGIRPIPDEERLDLTHYPKELVEF